MQSYSVNLSCEIPATFHCTKAAASLDINIGEKSKHSLQIQADIETPYNLGLIVGASGTGKTTLAKQIWGGDVFKNVLNESLPVIEQFPSEYTQDQRAALLNGVGLTSVPCWIRPAYTLSNGQKARAEIALLMATDSDLSVIDEWTSVVDRNSAKIMSHCVQKYTRRTGKRIVLLSCHYDVIDWLNPDWIIDCNKQEYTDRRLLCRSFERSEKIQFDIREVERKTWGMFSKYHYLSKNLPSGHIECFGLFQGQDQVGFCCFANYVPWGDKTKPKKMHSNRVVILPEYVGIGLGIRFVNACSDIMVKRGYDVWAKLSSKPLIASRIKDFKNWKIIKEERNLKIKVRGNMKRNSGFREKVKTYTFRWIGSAAL